MDDNVRSGLYRMTQSGAVEDTGATFAPAVGVTDASGKLVGLVTGETIAEMVMLSEAMPRGSQTGPWGRPAGV